MAKQILGKSDNFTSEYCCSIVRIGEIRPIEGKDKIGWTAVNGETIVIRKDQVKEGDVMIYASNETQLHERFLGANNLFEPSYCELNSNYDEVKQTKESVRMMRQDIIPKIEKKKKTLTKALAFFKSYETVMAGANTEEEKKAVRNNFKTTCDVTARMVNGIDENLPVSVIISKVEDAVTDCIAQIADYKERIDVQSAELKTKAGFFSGNCRVRAIRLGGVRSMGYLFSLDELSKFNADVKDINLSEMVGTDFDTVDGELFVKAYVPKIPERGSKGGGNSRDRKANKKLERFDKMVKGEFQFHYSTDPFAKNVYKFKPTDVVSISVKVHGTSFIVGKLRVKTPIKLPWKQRLLNWFIDTTGLFKNHKVKDYIIEYGNVTSSRKQIKNQYINKNVGSGYYDVDLWTEYGDLLYPYLADGMTVYGEIYGYVTGSETYIQGLGGGYDYGTLKGTNKLMPYRITTTNPDGTKKEWSVMEVKEWTEKLISDVPELAEKVQPIYLLYHGTLGDLYPDLSTSEHWHENVLEAMRTDVEHFAMDLKEPLCINNVPREGIVIRIDDDPIAEAYKLKTFAFIDLEKSAIDKGEVDTEMLLESAGSDPEPNEA